MNHSATVLFIIVTLQFRNEWNFEFNSIGISTNCLSFSTRSLISCSFSGKNAIISPVWLAHEFWRNLDLFYIRNRAEHLFLCFERLMFLKIMDQKKEQTVHFAVGELPEVALCDGLFRSFIYSFFFTKHMPISPAFCALQKTDLFLSNG